MSVLADFLAADRDATVQLFAQRTSSPGLAAQLPAALAALEDALRQGNPALAAAGSPASTDDLASLLRAYGELRTCLYDRMEAADLRPSLRDLRLLSEALSASLDGATRPHQLGEDSSRTRQRAAEAALAASEARYRTLFETIDDAFCVLEVIFDEHDHPLDYRFIEANAAFERQTGLHRAVGKRMRELVPDHDQHWFDIYGRVALTGESTRFENHAAAMGRWFDVYASRVGRPEQRQVALVFKDITARKKADQERDHLLRALARSNESLDQFAYIASHDLKAPLRGIASLSHWIEEDLGDTVSDETRQNLGLLRSRVQRLEALINGILDYSTAGRRKSQPEPVDTGKLLADVIELLAPPDHITLTVAAPLPTVVAEKVPLQQVFMNLIGNAVKHTQHDGAAIRVEARDEDSFVHFTVADNGPGIAPQYHERIWGVFQKLETRAQVEGTGIGLSVVKKIVETRGGRVWVESQEGQGATFHVVWPREPVDEG